MILTKLSLIFVLILTGCRGSQPKQATPEITSKTSESEDGYHDFVFLIKEQQRLPDGSQVISASGLHQGKPVGIQIMLGPSWKEGSIDLGNSSLVTYQGNVTYRSIGAESDLLLQTMDQLYGTKLTPRKMKNEITFTAISLAGHPQDLKAGMTKIKLFFETEKEDDEAELFTNIDLGEMKVYVNEKDAGYRSAVIRALMSP